MQDVELYAELILSLEKWTRREVKALSEEELAWQPDAEGNSIAVTVWHFSRWLDITGRFLQDKSASEELWLTRGWAERTGYNPQGIGYEGLGAITGYTPQEAARVPLLSLQDLLTYLQEVCSELSACLRALSSSEILSQPIAFTPGPPTMTKQQLLRTVFMGACGHVGEIEALKAMMKRARAAA